MLGLVLAKVCTLVSVGEGYRWLLPWVLGAKDLSWRQPLGDVLRTWPPIFSQRQPSHAHAAPRPAIRSHGHRHVSVHPEQCQAGGGRGSVGGTYGNWVNRDHAKPGQGGRALWGMQAGCRDALGSRMHSCAARRKTRCERLGRAGHGQRGSTGQHCSALLHVSSVRRNQFGFAMGRTTKTNFTRFYSFCTPKNTTLHDAMPFFQT